MSLRYETSLRETKQMTNLHEEYKVISILFICLHPRVVHPTNGCPSLLAVVAGQRLHLGGYEKECSPRHKIKVRALYIEYDIYQNKP